MGDYQVRRSVNCRSRGELLEFCVLRMPLLAGVGSPGLFKTWKKSALKRSLARSVREKALNSDAERLNAHGAGTYWFIHEGRLVFMVVRTTLPSFSGTQTVCGSQNCEIFVL